ncbi:hypothetical protein AAA214_23275 [Parabacteroides goldsteinii]|jgi:uncharacterized membrane protein YjgN (DUF898 family)|uniref:hypothetical protein n=1 Tax=Parabacteroides goldsteinii TaxID=328812 RepID=UPI001C763689|nr:MAG TPA: hypothetical protein [Caudoviricetes sp.]
MENTELTNNGFYYFDYKGAIFYNMLAIMKNICTFAVLQVDELNHLAGQAINLLNCLLGIFYVQILRYWRLPIRKLRLAFRGEVHQLVAAYMVTAFLLPIK